MLDDLEGFKETFRIIPLVRFVSGIGTTQNKSGDCCIKYSGVAKLLVSLHLGFLLSNPLGVIASKSLPLYIAQIILSTLVPAGCPNSYS